MRASGSLAAGVLVVIGVAVACSGRAQDEGQAAPAAKAKRPAAAPKEPAKPQPRPHGQRVAVDPALVSTDDGDTVDIRWPGGDRETVRVLGIDTPEIRHDEHSIPYDQPFGREASAFCKGVLAAANGVELLRSPTLDPYGRTLGYLFVNGKNYSTLVIRAGLAEETVSFYGDNGLPKESQEVLQAARAVGPHPFEPPHVYRKRMRTLTDDLKARGAYPPH
jgi:endonuclease YncB( thermonuclease family)